MSLSRARQLPSGSSTSASGSQTLSRGLTALEILADADTPLSIDELAEQLGVHRSNAYRVLRTLEDHRLVLRDDRGLIKLGPRLLSLAKGVAPELHTAALPALTEVAYSLGMTAFLTLLDADEIITVVTVEPTNVAATVSRNPGVKHHVGVGALSHAIEASLSPREREALLGDAPETEAARSARELGYAYSEGEVVAGVEAIAVPLRVAGEPPAAIAVVHFTLPEDRDSVVAALNTAAAQISANYR